MEAPTVEGGHGRTWPRSFILRCTLAALLFTPSISHAQQNTPKCPPNAQTGLPLPSCYGPTGLADYERLLLDYLQKKKYGGWATDKGEGLRDTGPFLAKQSWGTHPAVRIWYSPQVMDWLKGDRSRPLPNGSVIIKEQYPPPAAQYTPPVAPASDWTVMIRDSAGSQDGWYWGELWPGMPFDDYSPSLLDNPYRPMTGFGLYCYNCHASAEKELTFSSLNNIRGQPGEPLTFRVDNSWRTPSQPPPVFAESSDTTGKVVSASLSTAGGPPQGSAAGAGTLARGPFHRMGTLLPNLAERLKAFADRRKQHPGLLDAGQPPAPPMVPEFYDPVVRNPADPKQLFVTSDQCMPCHSGTDQNGNLTMILQGPTGSDGTAPLVNVSPYAEWRWSPMGLAGRDPIFYAQFASEMAYLDTLPPPQRDAQKTEVRNLCFSCHGVMGKRQLDIDSGGAGGWGGGVQGDFREEFIYDTNLNGKNFRYGALARDGVSCTACHHTVQTQPTSFQNFLLQGVTGNFSTGSPNQLSGPFKDNEIVTDPMKHALGIEPRFDSYMKSPRLCGSCHVINLPVVDAPKPMHNLEQSTYLEWVNSSFQNEFGTPGPNAQSCQDCHMSTRYDSATNGIHVSPIQTQFAAIEDQTYPAADKRLPIEKINVRYRTTGFVRHQLQGLNVFLLRMFNQFNDLLGVRKLDFMSGSEDDLPTSIDNITQQARSQTATLAVAARLQSHRLIADVQVSNLTGHRFPSGVGFRRAFIELRVTKGSGSGARTLWVSGQTNDKGVILGPDGRPLPTESFEGQQYQPHFSVKNPITRPDQVQIYEELTTDADNKITTSFIRRDHILKDNRLLPRGWSSTGPSGAFDSPELKYFLEATYPEGEARTDPTYQNGSGTSQVRYELPLPADIDPSTLRVTATLYYQATPPYYLQMRFREAPAAPATQRLKYLADHLTVAGTEIADWKLQVASASAPVGR